jgi:hypothetical protein
LLSPLNGGEGSQNQIASGQINIENVYLLCKDLLANPCREIGAGGLCPP